MCRVLVVACAVVLFVAPAMAQDAVKVDPKHYKVEFENEDVRVLRITYGPHEQSVMHEHPRGVAIFMTDGHVKMTLPDGTTADLPTKAGQVVWTEKEKHLPENTADTPLEVIQVEFKK